MLGAMRNYSENGVKAAVGRIIVDGRTLLKECCSLHLQPLYCIVFLLLPFLLEHRASVKHRFTSVS
jgi:hypothetical protein